MTTTLLAVDDSKTLRKVFEITFAGEPQFNVVLANSAQDALDKLGTVAPAIALVDVTLPDQNGYELCGQIKARSPSTAVIIFSSKQAPYDHDRGAAAAADDFIDKPFDTQQLIDKVTRLASGEFVAPAVPAAQPIASVVEIPRPAVVSAAPPVPAPPRVASGAPPIPRRITSTPPPKPKSAIPGLPGSSAVSASAGLSAEQLAGLGLSAEQVDAVMALSRDVVERVVWEVVPVLAETLIKEEIRRLTAE